MNIIKLENGSVEWSLVYRDTDPVQWVKGVTESLIIGLRDISSSYPEAVELRVNQK